MKILVAGGAGFLGSHLCEFLLSREHEVRALVHYNTDNIRHLDDVEVFKGDIRFRDECREAIKDVESVVNLAALIHVDRSRRYPQLFWETNVGGTMNLLEASRQQDAKFLQMSTCEIIGHVPEGKADEEYPFARPRSPYAASKYAAESYCHAYNETYGGVNIVRGFNLCGPRQKKGSKGAVIPIFISRMLSGVPPRIYGSGQQIRDFTDARDMAKGLTAFLESNISGELIHLCSGIETSIKEVANIILRSFNSNMTPVHVEARPGELMRSVGDNAKAKKLLGWEPSITLKESIEDTKTHMSLTKIGTP